MKRILKIALIVILFLLALLIVIPLAFKGKILEIARDEINKNLNAKVEFADLKLSLIRNFPNLTVSLIDLSVSGIDDFQGDTLVTFKAFRTVVDIKSVFAGPSIRVRSILLDQPRVKAVVLSDGRANWDIMIDSDAADVEVAADDHESSSFQVQLQRFEIRNGRVEYDDDPLGVRMIVGGLDGVMRGDLTQDFTSLDISASSSRFSFWYENIRYINDARLIVNTLMDFDLQGFKFTFSDNEILLNELVMGLEGFFAMPGSDFEMDVNFFSKKADFKTILSLVPAIYMSGFEGLTAEGSLFLEGFARGTMTDETMPSVGIELFVEDAAFSYPDLPESLDNLNMSLNVYYDGVDEDRTSVELERFYMEMAGNPFEMKMSIRTPVSDMAVDAELKGTIDFTSLADVIPMEGVNIRGLFESDLLISGRMSEIENERYEEFNAKGSMKLTAFQYNDPDLPYGISIPVAGLAFSPRFVELTDFESQIGNSDLRMSGRLENFIPYVFNDGTITGNLLFYSSLLDLNELIGGETRDETVTDTVSLSIIEIPGDIDFTFASSIEKLLFDNMEINRLKGRIIVRDSRLVLEDVNMEMLDGTIGITGEYNTADMNAPFINFSLDINGFDIPSSFHTFNTVQQLTPVARDLRGNFSASMDLRSFLDDGMMPVMNSVDAGGRLRTDGVELVSSTTFDRLSQALRLREDRDNVLRNIDLRFSVANGRVNVEPFKARLGPVEMVIGGSQGIDQTLNYIMNMTIPRSLFGPGAGQLIDDLASSAAARGLNIRPGDNVNVDAKIAGTFSDPQITLDMAGSARDAMDQIREQIKTQAREEIDRRVEQVEDSVREEASERADQIIKEAELRADQVRKAAREAARTVIREGEEAAERIEREVAGRGRIAEAAAKRSADGVRREAQRKSEELVSEADQQADKILESAREEADRIR